MTEPWRQLHRYWLSKHVDGRPPNRDELDPPLEVPRLAQSLLLIDVTPDGFEYRLAGTKFVKGAQIDMTGRMVGASGLFPHVIASWIRALRLAHETQQPQLLAGRFAPHVTAKVMLVLLPLAPAPDGVPKLLGGMFVEGEFAPSTEIEALDLIEIAD